MAEISGSSYRSQAEERMRENARRASVRLAEQRKEEERQRRQREAQEKQRRKEERQRERTIVTSDEVFPPEEGELSEVTRFRRGEPISDEVPRGYVAAPSLRGEYPSAPLPTERMLSEAQDFTEDPSHRPLPSRFTGALLGSVTGGPTRAAMRATQEERQRPAEAEIFETIVGSGREMYGHPEPPTRGGFTRRGDLGKEPHPTFLRNYKNFYNDFSKDMQEGTLFPRGTDLLEFVSELDRLQSSLLEKFERSASLEIGRGTPLYQKFPMVGRRIPASKMLADYEAGDTERFNQFVRELARVQALKQAIGDYGQVFGLEREQASQIRDQSKRAKERARDREEFSR